MKKCLFTIILILFLDSIVFATAQISDKIIYEGECYKLFTNPLERYFKLHPNKRPETEVISTDLWRGYVATFEIKDKKLFIKDIEIQVWKDTINHDTEWKTVITDVFPEKDSLHCNWFSGLLVIPKGELINYVHMGYASEYEAYTVFKISSGILEKAKDFSHKDYVKFKKRQFKEFQKTEEYKKIFNELKKDNDDPEFIREFIYIYVIEYTTKFLVDF